MSPTGRDLAIWGGGTWVLLVVGVCVLYWRGASLSDLTSTNDKSYAEYQKLYHPDNPKDGVYVADDEADLTKAKESQGQQLERAEAELVPQLPDSYRLVDGLLNENASIVSQDQQILNTDAMSRGVNLAAKGPYSQLEQDTLVRARQMAELYLYRLVLHCAIDAKVKRVNSVKILQPSIDPTHSYDLYSCQFDLDTSFESGQRLLEELAYAAKLGISLTYLRITPSPSDPSQRQVMSFVATLITPHLSHAAPARAGGT